MRFSFRSCRRVLGISALFITALSIGACDATNETGYDYQGASMHITCVMNAIDIRLEPAAHPAGWTVISNTSAKFNGLCYWNPVFQSDRIMVPFAYIGVAAILLSVICLFPDFFLMLRNADRAWNNQCIPCGYNLTGNTSGICPECGSPAPADRRPLWQPSPLSDDRHDSEHSGDWQTQMQKHGR